MSIESGLARAAEDVMQAGENLVETVLRARDTGVEPSGVVLQLVAGHEDPCVDELRSWVIDVVEQVLEPWPTQNN